MANDQMRGGDNVGGLVVALGALLFGAIVVLGRLVAETVPVTSVLSIRFGVAGLVLVLILLLSGRSLRPAPGEGPRLLFLGAGAYAVESAFFFLALGRGTAATVTLLFYTYPVWVAVISAALGLGLPGWLLGASLVAAVAGAGLVIASSGGLDITTIGIVFSLASALTISLYLIVAEVMVKRTPALVASMWICLGASAAQGAYSVLSGTGRFPTGAEEWLPVLGMGVLTSGAMFLLFLGVRRVGAVRTSIISSLEPVFAAVLAFVFLDEPLRAGVLGGGALILAGAVTAAVARRIPEPQAGVP